MPSPMYRQGNHLHPGSRRRGHCHTVKGPDGPSQVCIPAAAVRHTPEMEHAISVALRRAQAALGAGRLISPGEAMALAGPAARTKETLFSIARDVAGETQTDQDEILAELNRRFPDLG
jgi:hypothetical protein